MNKLLHLPICLCFCFLLSNVISLKGQSFGNTTSDSTTIKQINSMASKALDLVYTKPDSTASLTDEILVQSEAASYPYGVGRSYFIKGYLAKSKKEYDLAYSWFRKAITVFEPIKGGHPGLRDCYENLGFVFYYQSKIDSASIATEKALEIGLEHNMIEEVAGSYNNLGIFQEIAGNNDKALQYYFDALTLSHQHGNGKHYEFVPTFYLNIANIYSHEEEHRKSVNTLCIADSIRQIIHSNQPRQQLTIYQKLAAGYSELHMPDSVEYYARKIIAISKETTFKEYEGIGYRLLGYAFENRSQLDSALFYHTLAYENKALQKIPILYINSILNMGATYQDLGKHEAAKGYFEQAVQHMNEYNIGEIKAEVYKRYAVTLAALGDYKTAFDYLKNYSDIRDSTFTDEKQEIIESTRTKYQVMEKEALIAQKELTISKQQVTQKNLLIGAISGVLILLGIFQYIRTRQKLKRQQTELALQLEKAEAAKLREVDQLKSNFFANISHEFRTPLTLILSPVEQMLDGTIKGQPDHWLRVIKQNGNRLLHLINQILDLSRLDAGKMEFKAQTIDANQLFKAIAYSFESLADSKQIEYQVKAIDDVLPVEWDAEKVEKILTNLLSNAFKFTPEEKGKISAAINVHDYEVQFEISDNGIGISEKDAPYIFDRFHQGSSSHEFGMSSGIGLALTRELVELHQGTISVESQENKGSIFRVTLPIGSPTPSAISAVEVNNNMLTKTSLSPKLKTSENLATEKTRLLIVEDNADLREYIKAQLLDQYQILEANDGEAGLQQAIEKTPDLIISDVMMPRMNGIDMCTQLKRNEKTSHIPVILLTAKAEQSDKLEGLQTGADAYVTKPFDPKELNIRVAKLIEQRKNLRAHFSSDFNFKPTEVTANSVDMIFLKAVKEAIENHMADELFGVPELSKAMGFSRSQLHRKLTALTNKSPSQLIREMRLYHAKELLEKKVGNASEVTYLCGFNSLAHFSKSFKEFFGVNPSEV